ncbi:autophagy-related protein 13b isoform X2 [Lathyrus oleraceus]|uniref:autophagy-related protein 13b isoform X2 n=1 Tax=Pisum sativum TaxID=3888 RepID=UPI0021CEB410|nr:autophagy-related protein 13b-like isoform X2 [Pisum sativum]
MVLSHGNAHSHTAKMEQIITEFFAKSLRIILESRALNVSLHNGGDKSDSSPCLSSSPLPSVRPRDKWFNSALRECPAAMMNINNLECLIIDVILVHRSLDRDPMVPKRVLPKSSSMKELRVEAKSEKIVERWVVQYENKKIQDSNSGSKRSSNFSLQNLYKKLTDILRSLYGKVRLLPAYQIFKYLSSSAEIRPFTLAHSVSSFVEPFTLKEESEMMKYRFSPVDTSSGRLCLKVLYYPSAANLFRNPLSSLFPRVIPDYVRSPLADSSRKLPSLLPRRLSYNFDDCKASSTSITDSSLPIYSKSRISVSNSSSCIQKNGTSVDDCCNPSPSPSIYHIRSSSSTTVLRSESAPVSKPNAAEAVNSSGYTDRSTNVMQSGATAEKVFSLGKDEPQKCYGDRISANSLQRISVYRRSHRDDVDGTEFSCPFAVDYDDMKGPAGRYTKESTTSLSRFLPIRTSIGTPPPASNSYLEC